VSVCPVYYLKATFGRGTDEALLEIPVSVTGNLMFLFSYQISSPKIGLNVGVSKAGTVGFLPNSNRDQAIVGRWNRFQALLDSDVGKIVLLAKKTGVTMTDEYVLVDLMKIDFIPDTNGNNYYITVHAIGRPLYYITNINILQYFNGLLSCSKTTLKYADQYRIQWFRRKTRKKIRRRRKHSTAA